MNNLLVSIIIPTYNRAHLIGETLDSVLLQTYENWECIIVDDGSTDNTVEVVNEYVKKDSRFKFHYRPAERLQGGNAARNYGFELSKGSYIIWYDSDDVMLPEKLECHINLFIEDPEINVSVLNSYYYNFKTKNPYASWREQLFSEDLLNDFIIQKAGWQTGDGLWKKSDLKFLFNEDLKSSQDWEFHVKNIFLQNIGFKDICMSYIRHTPGSIKNSSNFSKILSEYNSRKSVLNFNKKHNQINEKGFRKILSDLCIYFYYFWGEKKIKLFFMVFKDILNITCKLKEYKFFTKKFILYYPNKFCKNDFHSYKK